MSYLTAVAEAHGDQRLFQPHGLYPYQACSDIEAMANVAARHTGVRTTFNGPHRCGAYI